MSTKNEFIFLNLCIQLYTCTGIKIYIIKCSKLNRTKSNSRDYIHMSDDTMPMFTHPTLRSMQSNKNAIKSLQVMQREPELIALQYFIKLTEPKCINIEVVI